MSTVQQTNERMVFLVPSDRNPRIAYRVDLTAQDGAGQCSCTDWSTRRGPALRAGAEPWTEKSLCKHVRRAGRHFLRDLLQAMAKSESTPANK
jgi:hypothetical protein